MVAIIISPTVDKTSRLIKKNLNGVIGFELAVLETIPWQKVDIEVLSVEIDLAGIFQKGTVS